jgi:hypothetical protein
MGILRVEEKNDEVNTLCEPLHNLVEIVVAVQLLLFTAQHARRVDEGKLLKDRRLNDAPLEPTCTYLHEGATR